MNAPLITSASDLRPTVVQPETNADQPNGFTQVPNEVLFDRSLSDGAQRLYAVLLHYARASTKCWPSQDRLASDLGICRKTVQRRLTELESRSLITHRRGGDGKPSYYLLSVTAQHRPEPRQARPSLRQDCPEQAEQMGHFCPTEEEHAVDAVRRNTSPPPPTTTKAAGGGGARLHSTANDTAPVNDELLAFLSDCGVWQETAQEIARTGLSLLAAQLCWRDIRDLRRVDSPGAVMAYRLRERASDYEQLADEKRREEQRRLAIAREADAARIRNDEVRHERNAAFDAEFPEWAQLLSYKGDGSLIRQCQKQPQRDLALWVLERLDFRIDRYRQRDRLLESVADGSAPEFVAQFVSPFVECERNAGMRSA